MNYYDSVIKNWEIAHLLKGKNLRIKPYILPYNERRRLHGRAYRAQQKNHLEVCGVMITGKDRILELVFIKNDNKEPYHFSIPTKVLKPIKEEAKRRDKKILGLFHSHPLSIAAPGKGDFDSFYHGYSMIYDVCAMEARLWRLIRTNKGKMAEEVPLILEPGRK